MLAVDPDYARSPRRPRLAACRSKAGWKRRRALPRSLRVTARTSPPPTSASAARARGAGRHGGGRAMLPRGAAATSQRSCRPYARLATLLRGKLPEADLDGAAAAAWPTRTDVRRIPADLHFGLAHVLDARRRLRAGRRLTCGRPTPSAWRTAEARKQGTTRTEHHGSLTGHRRPSRPPSSSAPVAGPGQRAAGLHRRSAPLGDDAGRAGAGQPFAGPRGRRTPPGPRSLRGRPRRLGCDRAASACVP